MTIHGFEELAKHQSGSCVELEADDKTAVDHHIDEGRQRDTNNGEQKQRLDKDKPCSGISARRKKNLQSSVHRQQSTNHTSEGVSNSLLSFIRNPPSPSQPRIDLSSGASSKDKSIIKKSTKKNRKSLSTLSKTELLEKARKREFVQGLVSSAMFDHLDNF